MLANEDETLAVLDQTSEHGKILMTIDSLYAKIIAKEQGADEKKSKQNDFVHSNLSEIANLEGFDDIKACEVRAAKQLKIIGEYVRNFKKFKDKWQVQQSKTSEQKNNETGQELDSEEEEADAEAIAKARKI